jgi:predicted Zn-dependent protease
LFAALRTEAAFAAVLSHEMAHDLLGHQALAYQRATQGSHPAVSYNIEEEIHADSLGALLLERAGYEPTAALSALTLFYRTPGREVSEKKEREFDKRTAALRSHLSSRSNLGPTTENSREYNRVRRALLPRPPAS